MAPKASTDAATINETREEANFLFIVTFLKIRHPIDAKSRLQQPLADSR